MRKRILRHLNQRSEMLSGISHDLRTPLTRMKIQIEFIEDKELSKKLSEDINEMEKMLNEYLQFTSSSYLEKDEEFNISELVDEIVKKYENEKMVNIYIYIGLEVPPQCVDEFAQVAHGNGKPLEVRHGCVRARLPPLMEL